MQLALEAPVLKDRVGRPGGIRLNFLTGGFLFRKRPAHFYLPLVSDGSVAAGGLKNLNDCFQSDPAVDARPRRFPIELAAPGPEAATEFSWLAVGNRPTAVIEPWERRMTRPAPSADIRFASEQNNRPRLQKMASPPPRCPPVRPRSGRCRAPPWARTIPRLNRRLVGTGWK